MGIDEPLVVAMPMNSISLALRGFNQVKILAEVLATDFELQMVHNVLRRRFCWYPQASLVGIKRRLNNVAGIFTTISKEVVDRDIFLVDDVFTTGATVRECAQSLFMAGARSVTVIVAMKG